MVAELDLMPVEEFPKKTNNETETVEEPKEKQTRVDKKKGKHKQNDTK